MLHQTHNQVMEGAGDQANSQDATLGKARARRFRAGRLRINDFVDEPSKVLTLGQLHHLYLSTASRTTPSICLSFGPTGTYSSAAPQWHLGPTISYNASKVADRPPAKPLGGGTMAENLDILNAAVSLLIRAALLVARFSGRIRQRYLKR